MLSSYLSYDLRMSVSNFLNFQNFKIYSSLFSESIMNLYRSFIFNSVITNELSKIEENKFPFGEEVKNTISETNNEAFHNDNHFEKKRKFKCFPSC